ncbi:hypothetical protein GDO81_005401 [Engystomops pustulosus]|uniref:Uncharacterized protein n=1 Tax=Engystomops pustulosus TaxID=76066 RepID=A0AAV7CNB9_ENGPU|nr:hypothetical protein GDO81_005401 [Engystomops pustulosus]
MPQLSSLKAIWYALPNADSCAYLEVRTPLSTAPSTAMKSSTGSHYTRICLLLIEMFHVHFLREQYTNEQYLTCGICMMQILITL